MKFSSMLRWSINDTLTLIGIGMTFWGLYLWWPPLAWMVIGIFLVVLGVTRESSES